MSKKTKRKLISLEISSPARGAMSRIIRKTGWTKTRVLDRALTTAEANPEFFKI
jgi:DNA-binding phage protein